MWYFLCVAHGKGTPEAIRSRRPKDVAAAAKLARLMDNMGLSPEVLGAQTGVSGKRIRQIVTKPTREHPNSFYGDQPERRVRHALARRFDLLPAHIWKADALGLAPGELEHLLALARRQEMSATAVAA